MRIHFARVIAAGALIAIGCGGSGNNNNNVAPPTAPSVPAAQPAAVNVGGNSQTQTMLSWAGQASDDQGGSGTVNLTLQQSGTQVTGTIFVQVLAHSGPFTGTVSGNTLSFNFSVGNSGNGCGNAISGTATVSSVNTLTARPNTTNTMTGTFSGKDCTGGAVTNGTFTASLQDPPDSATRFPIAGTWTGFVPPQLGGGSWTWTLAQDGDVSGGNLTGSVTISPDPLNFGKGTVTGTVTNVFPGPPEWATAVTTVSFGGACPATLTINWGNLVAPASFVALSQDGLTMTSTTFSGSNCNGAIAPFKPGLKRQ